MPREQDRFHIAHLYAMALSASMRKCLSCLDTRVDSVAKLEPGLDVAAAPGPEPLIAVQPERIVVRGSRGAMQCACALALLVLATHGRVRAMLVVCALLSLIFAVCSRSVEPTPAPQTPPPCASKGLSLTAPDEMATIESVKRALRAPPMPPNLPANDEILTVQVLRFVREHGRDSRRIERLFRKALAYKREALPQKPELDELATSRWLCSAEMPHGGWAQSHWPIGMHCGFSLSGSPVKIERIGACPPPKDTVKLYPFYLGLVDCLQQRLDLTSVEKQQLQQTYEIFDLKGLGAHMVNFTTLSFTKDVIRAFATHYPSSFSKAVVINAPSLFVGLYRVLSKLLSPHVIARVNILGQDWEEALSRDLTEEALYWVACSNAELCRAPFRATGTAAS